MRAIVREEWMSFRAARRESGLTSRQLDRAIRVGRIRLLEIPGSARKVHREDLARLMEEVVAETR